MPTAKHKIFKIKLSDDGKFTVHKAIESAINEFLADSNNVYINHSITTLTEDVESYGSQKTVCRYVLISIVYKDINGTAFNVKRTSKQVKDIVHKEVESDSELSEPTIETEIDKEIRQLNSGISQ